MTNFISRKINRLLNKNYSIAKARAFREYCQQHANPQHPLIIYQMGKVGSSTLVRSFKESNAAVDIFQVHFLTDQWIDIVDGQYHHASKVHKRFILDEHWFASKFLNKLIRENPDRVWKVITLVRDPIARNISTFFQAFDVYFAEDAKRFTEADADLAELSHELIDIFLNKFKEHDVPLNWFDIHMKPVFGIDLLAEPFPKSDKYQIVKGDRAEVLILRLEDLNATARQAMDEFMGIKDFAIANANISSDKGYADAYSRFKNLIKLPQDYIDRMYSSRFMQHFYSADDIDRFRAKWTKQ